MSMSSRSQGELSTNDPEYQRWLRDEYVPIAGGWQY